MDMKVDCILVDIQSNEIITEEKISHSECDRRNAEAKMVGEVYLQWKPFPHNAQLEGRRPRAGR